MLKPDMPQMRTLLPCAPCMRLLSLSNVSALLPAVAAWQHKYHKGRVGSGIQAAYPAAVAPLREVAELEQRQRVAARGRRLRAGRQQQRVRERGARTAKLVWQHIKTARLLPPLSVVCQNALHGSPARSRARNNSANEGRVQSEQGLKLSKSEGALVAAEHQSYALHACGQQDTKDF